MDEKFTQEEQTAIASVLYNLAGADFQTHQGKNMLEMKAYETLKKMPMEKKRTFSRMMTQIARSDGHFGPREQAFVKEVLDYCDVPFVQK